MEQVFQEATTSAVVTTTTPSIYEEVRRQVVECQQCDGKVRCPHFDYIRPLINSDGAVHYELCEFGQKRNYERRERDLAAILGKSPDEVHRALKQERIRLARVAPLIKARYDVSEDWEVKAIDGAERELEQCQGCTGECQKLTDRHMIPVIRKINGAVNIAHAFCPHGEQRYLSARSKKAGVPDQYADKTFADYEVTTDNRRAVDLAKKFCTLKPSKGLYLFGECGTGKTFLASLIAKEFLREFKSVLFDDVPGLLDRIKATFDNSEENYQDVFESLRKCDLLILDDLGAGHLTAWNVGQLYQIINTRYATLKPLIVTSNFDLKGLETHFGQFDKLSAKRIASRLTSMCAQGFLGMKDRRRLK